MYLFTYQQVCILQRSADQFEYLKNCAKHVFSYAAISASL